jgi:hypothetical protein
MQETRDQAMVMRAALAASGLVALVLLALPARAETWCIRDAGSPPPGACVFPSSHDCGMAARMSPFGGICERQPLGYGGQAGDRPTSGQRPSRRKRTSQR